MVDLAGEPIRRQPLDQCVRIEKRPVDPFGGGGKLLWNSTAFGMISSRFSKPTLRSSSNDPLAAQRTFLITYRFCSVRT